MPFPLVDTNLHERNPRFMAHSGDGFRTQKRTFNHARSKEIDFTILQSVNLRHSIAMRPSPISSGWVTPKLARMESN